MIRIDQLLLNTGPLSAFFELQGHASSPHGEICEADSWRSKTASLALVLWQPCRKTSFATFISQASLHNKLVSQPHNMHETIFLSPPYTSITSNKSHPRTNPQLRNLNHHAHVRLEPFYNALHRTVRNHGRGTKSIRTVPWGCSYCQADFDKEG